MPQSNNNNTTSISNIARKDRTKIFREYKKINCLDTLAKKYECSISQIEMIINEKTKTKKKKTRAVPKEVNAHLVSLLDKVVYEWFQRAQRLIETGTVTEEMFLQKAQESAQIFGISNLTPDYEWVRTFRKKYNITNLDMTMLRIENDNARPLSADINEVVMYILENNPITEFISYSNLQQNATSVIEVNNSQPDDDRIPITQYVCLNNNNEIITSESFNNITAELQIDGNSETITCDNFDIPSAEVQICDNDNNETITSDNFDEQPVEVERIDVLPAGPVITNNEEARRYLKAIEDYVLLKENFRAIGLISQLEEILRAETEGYHMQD